MALGIKLFDIVDLIGSKLHDNIEDVNKSRTNNRWIFPTFPKSSKNLPQITIELGSITYETDSGNNYLGEEQSGNVYKIYKYKKSIAPLNLYIISGKEQEYEVIYNLEKLFLTNQKLNIYIANMVKDYIRNNEKEFFDIVSRIQVQSIEPTFDNNDYSWASTVSCEIEFKDIWVEEYVDGLLIKSYSLGLQTI